MSFEANAAGTVPASAPLLPDVSPVSEPATNGHDTNSSTNGQAPAAAKPSIDDDLMAVWTKLNPDRHPNGRFARRDDDAPAATTETTKELTADQPADTAASEQVSPAEATKAPATTPAIEAPLSWSAEMKAKVASLPPEFHDVAKYAAERDKETHAVITRAGQEIKAFEPLRNVIEHWAESFRRNNLSPHDGINRMMAMESWLGDDAPSAIKEIMRAYKVDLRDIAGQSQAAPAANSDPQAVTQGQIDPAVSGLQNELRQTQANLSKVMSHLTERGRREAEAEQAEVRTQQDTLARQIADFAKDKPHFDKVRVVMSSLLDTGAAQTLDDAYEQATFANKDIRTQRQAEEKAADEKKRADESAKKLVDAKRAGSVNVKSTVGSATTPKTMDDTLREVARRMMS